MTYRQALQKLLNDLDVIYDSAGVLRDASNPETEQQTWNEVRALTSNAMVALNKLDNKLTDGRANVELGYTV